MFRHKRCVTNLPIKVVDAKGHIMGKLAATVAKQALIGNARIVIVRAEEAVITGHEHRNFMHYASYLRKHVNTDHGKGQFHHRNPRGIMRKAIRGMVPRKTVRGQEALSRVTVFEGVPRKYEKLRKHTVPAALHHLHAKYQKFTKLSSISNRFGWKYSKVVENFEAKRKLQAAAGVKRVLKSKSILQQAKTRKSSELQSLENRYLKFFEVSV